MIQMFYLILWSLKFDITVIPWYLRWRLVKIPSDSRIRGCLSLCIQWYLHTVYAHSRCILEAFTSLFEGVGLRWVVIAVQGLSILVPIRDSSVVFRLLPAARVAGTGSKVLASIVAPHGFRLPQRHVGSSGPGIESCLLYWQGTLSSWTPPRKPLSLYT